MKKVAVILGFFSAIFLASSIFLYHSAIEQKAGVDRERLQRMEIEEELFNLSAKKSELEQVIANLQGLLVEREAAAQAIQQMFKQEIANLKNELRIIKDAEERSGRE